MAEATILVRGFQMATEEVGDNEFDRVKLAKMIRSLADKLIQDRNGTPVTFCVQLFSEMKKLRSRQREKRQEEVIDRQHMEDLAPRGQSTHPLIGMRTVTRPMSHRRSKPSNTTGRSKIRRSKSKGRWIWSHIRLGEWRKCNERVA